MVHVFVSPSNVMVVGLTDLFASRNIFPTKLFPGAIKCTEENLSSNEEILRSVKLRTMFAWLIAYNAHSIIAIVINIFLCILYI